MKEETFLAILQKNKHPLCFYHRAVSGDRESKSLTHIVFVLKKYKILDAIEFDVQKTRDNHIIVRHDFAIRTDRGYQWVSSLTLDEYRKYCSADDSPLLKDFLKVVAPSDILLDIEIKNSGIAKKVINTCKRAGVYERTMFTSIYSKIVKEVYSADKKAVCMYGYPRDRGKNLAMQSWTKPFVWIIVQYLKNTLPYSVGKIIEREKTPFFSFYHKVLTSDLVRRVHANHCYVAGATINLNNDMCPQESVIAITQMIQMGVDIVKIDHPELFQTALRNARVKQ